MGSAQESLTTLGRTLVNPRANQGWQAEEDSPARNAQKKRAACRFEDDVTRYGGEGGI